MSAAVGILKGGFGRVALLDLTSSLVRHAHHHCHVVLKASGPSRMFGVRDQLYPIDDDTAILVNTWEEHFYNHDPLLPQTQFLALYIEPEWLASIDRVLNSVTQPSFFPVTCVRLSRRSRVLADRLVEMTRYPEQVSRADLEAAIFDFVISLIEPFPDWRLITTAVAGADAPGDYRIRRAIRYMRENIQEATQLDQVARIACLSRPHFNARFKQCVGITPALFANVLRVEHAIGALSYGNRPVRLVAGDLGFSEQANFTRFFHQQVGAPPRDFRRALEVVGQTAH